MKKQPSLEYLLRKVDKAFGIKEKPHSWTYVYELGRIGGFWRFQVVDDWHAWFDRRLTTIEFEGGTPQAAVKRFLKYIKDNNINPAKLRSN